MEYRIPKINTQKLLLILGIIGIRLYNITFFAAEQRLSPQRIVLIFSFSSCLTTLLASIILSRIMY
ncbi:MAG: EamA family transporter [Burkholderiales bacterium]|nr:EamA family transporter [Burkholderiales bacterium]